MEFLLGTQIKPASASGAVWISPRSIERERERVSEQFVRRPPLQECHGRRLPKCQLECPALPSPLSIFLSTFNPSIQTARPIPQTLKNSRGRAPLAAAAARKSSSSITGGSSFTDWRSWPSPRRWAAAEINAAIAAVTTPPPMPPQRTAPALVFR